MAFCNSLQGTIKVVVLHGSSNKLTFKLDRKHVFNKSKFDFKLLFLNGNILFIYLLFSRRITLFG